MIKIVLRVGAKVKQKNMPHYRNRTEIRVLGLMRSGNHTIIEWIISQYQGQRICFLNNVKHGDNDPFTSCAHKRLVNIDHQDNIEALRNEKKDVLIYSYEDRKELEHGTKDLVSSVYQKAFDMRREEYLGASRYRFEIIIIRDPYNNLASRMEYIKKLRKKVGVSDLERIVKNWKALAAEAIKQKQHPQEGSICINFNNWVSSAAYRQGISKSINGVYNEESLKRTSEIGGGSSFDGPRRLTYTDVVENWSNIFKIGTYKRLNHYWKRLVAKPPDKMKIFDRWKRYANDDRYRELIIDPEIYDMSETIFGELPEIREYVKTLSSK